MLIQLHILQNYVPSNLNRDDSGSPKSAVFGGYPRGRISSQCLKRSMRRSHIFEEAFRENGLLADRTNRLPRLINQELEALGVDETARKNIINRLPELGGGAVADEESGELKTRVLVYLTPAEAKLVAQKLWEIYQEVGDKGFAKMKIKDLESQLAHETPRSVDMAMFGRMTTSVAFEDMQAAVQVAHAISTNALTREFDYFTAVDDISGETGAGMIGDLEMNSSTYYKYINICWEDLLKNLGGDVEVARQAVSALIMASAVAQPSGKQNSTAAHNLPDFMLVEISDKNIPVNYANAFLTPAQHNHNVSMMQDSIGKLIAYARQIQQTYGLNGKQACFTTQSTLPDDKWQPVPAETLLNDVENVGSLPKLQEWVAKKIAEVDNG